MSRDYRVFLDGTQEAATKILMYTSGYTRQQFEADPRTVDAVIRNFIVMGEAAEKNIPAEVRQLHPEIPWRDMAGLRDMVDGENPYWPSCGRSHDEQPSAVSPQNREDRLRLVKKALEILASVVKWTVITLLCVEVAAFITITGMNYVIYGIPTRGG